MLTLLYKDFYSWSKLEYMWLVLATLLVGLASFGAPPIEFVAAITNIVCVILVAKGRVSNYVWGLVGVLTYGIVAYDAGLFGNAALNLVYYLPMQFYGMYLWTKSKREGSKAAPDVKSRDLTKMGIYGYTLLLILGTLGYGTYLTTTADPFPFLDAFTAVGSVLAMWLMVKQYSAQWYIWILINIVTVYIWAVTASVTGGGLPILVMWLVFLGNSVYGAYKWKVVRLFK